MLIKNDVYKENKMFEVTTAMGDLMPECRIIYLIIFTILFCINGRKQIIFTAFWSKVLDFFYNWYIDSV